jgi:hypothetical protein
MLHLKLLEKQEQAKPKTSRNNKNKGQNEWNRDTHTHKTQPNNKKTPKNQQNKKLDLWKNKQDWKTPGKSDQKEEGKRQINEIRNEKER